MRVGIGYSENPDSEAAGKEAAQMALEKANQAQTCDLVLLFCTARHDQEALRNAVVSVTGNSKCVYGGGTAGIITNEYYGYAGDQAGIACIWLEGSEFTSISESGLEKSEIETGKKLGRRLLESGIKKESSTLLFYDAIDRSRGDVRLLLATWILEGIEYGMGELPELLGAGLQGDHACSETMQYTGSGMNSKSVISLSFSEDICIDHVIMHGCRPASPYYTVTKSEGPVILEINHMPALEFMDKVLDSAIKPEEYPFFLLFGLNYGEPWGEYEESNYASRLCMGIDKERQGIVMFEPDMVEGVEFQIMFRSLDLEYMKPKIESLLTDLDGKEPIFALYIDCAGRCAGYGGVDVEDAIVVQKALENKVPLLGIYTGAEIAPMGGCSRGLDLTGVFCLFSKRTESQMSDKPSHEKVLWKKEALSGNRDSVSIDSMMNLCEKNAAKVLALDNESITMRHELEQKRRGFSLLADLAVSLREGVGGEKVFLPVTQRINSALNMQKTAVLFPDENGRFFPYVLQGFSIEEQENLFGHEIEIEQELLSLQKPILVTAADDKTRLAGIRKILNLPYFVSSPVVVKNEIAAIFITGRMVETQPFLARLGRSDVETVQAISALLASVLVYRRLADANRQAQSDMLTGLLNRGAFEMKVTERLQEEAGTDKVSAFILVDCDCFKAINDNFGHMEGDMVLTTLSRFLEGNFRADDCVARVGGDEFAVFCSLADDEANIMKRIDRLIKVWSETDLTTKEGAVFHATVSIGISVAPRDGDSYDALSRNADIALYKSKELGRNRYTVYNAELLK